MKNLRNILTALVIATMALTSMVGCNASKTAKGAGIGAAAGAAIGGLLGNRSGETGKGAAIGGAIGAAVGAIIGDQMDRQAAELKQQLPDAEVVRDGEGIKVVFNSAILFGFDSDKLQANAQPDLKDLANSMKTYPGTALEIIGHTDSVGSDSYNQKLSERRASSVANFLKSQGVENTRLMTKGLGETQPVADNTSEAGRQQNRRVEIKINITEEYRRQLEQQQAQSGSNG